jgi:hypothetical protein
MSLHSHSLLIRMYTFVGAFEKLRKVTISFVLSVRIEQLGSHCSESHKIWYLSIFRNSDRKFQLSFKYDKNGGYVTWRFVYICVNLCTFMIISHSFVLRIRNSLVVQKIKVHFMVSIFFLEDLAVHEIGLMWNNMVQPNGPQMTIQYGTCALFAR